MTGLAPATAQEATRTDNSQRPPPPPVPQVNASQLQDRQAATRERAIDGIEGARARQPASMTSLYRADPPLPGAARARDAERRTREPAREPTTRERADRALRETRPPAATIRCSATSMRHGRSSTGRACRQARPASASSSATATPRNTAMR